MRNQPIVSARTGMLLARLLCAGAVALSVHVLLQQVIGVPYPDISGVPNWARLLRQAGEYAALAAVWWLARRPMATWHPACRILAIGLIHAMNRQVLRGAIMNGVVTTAFAYQLLRLLPQLAVYLIMAAIAGLAWWLPRRWWALPLAGGLLALIDAHGVAPAVAATLGRLVDSLPVADHAVVYSMPYGLPVLIPAYLTYLEPLAGACALYMLIWRYCAVSPDARVAIYCVLLEFLAGELVPPLVWSFFGERSWPLAFTSMAQFTLEQFVLALGVVLAWHTHGHGASQPRRR